MSTAEKIIPNTQSLNLFISSAVTFTEYNIHGCFT